MKAGRRPRFAWQYHAYMMQYRYPDTQVHVLESMPDAPKTMAKVVSKSAVPSAWVFGTSRNLAEAVRLRGLRWREPPNFPHFFWTSSENRENTYLFQSKWNRNQIMQTRFLLITIYRGQLAGSSGCLFPLDRLSRRPDELRLGSPPGWTATRDWRHVGKAAVAGHPLLVSPSTANKSTFTEGHSSPLKPSMTLQR